MSNSAKNWATEFAQKNTPKALDTLTKPLISKISSPDNGSKFTKEDEAAYALVYTAIVEDFLGKIEDSCIEALVNTYMAGLDGGLITAQQSLELAMKNCGFKQDKIKSIFENSKQYLKTHEEYETIVKDAIKSSADTLKNSNSEN